MNSRRRCELLHMAILALAAAVTVSSTRAQSAGVDLHRMWDDRCVKCHGHAGEFSRNYLRIENGVLVGRDAQRDLRMFMDNHYAAGADVDAIYAMLLAQAATRARFKDECGACHGRAAEMVRTSVVRQGSSLFGRSSGAPLDEFLVGHADLTVDDVPFYLQLMSRIESEVNP